MKVQLKTACTFFLLISIFVKNLALAERTTETPTKTLKETPPTPGVSKTLVDSHRDIAIFFDYMADGIDYFLTGKRLVKTQNKTRVTIENSNVLTEGTGFTTTNNIGVFLNLPNFEKYWQLKFTNYDQQTTDRGVRGSYLKQNTAEKNYGATVGLFREIDAFQFSFRPRILLEDPLNISHSMAMDTKLKTKYLEIKPRFELFATPQKGTGVFASLNSSLILDDIYTLNIINEGEYQEKFHLFTVTQGLSLGQIIDERSYLAYNLFFVSTNKPDYQLNNFNISPAYNRILYKDILDVQFSPGINFSKDQHWHGVTYAALNFYLYF